MSSIYGSLCLSATTPQKEFPQFHEVKTSFHTPHQFRGRVDVVQGDGAVTESVLLPARKKEMCVYTYAPKSDWNTEVNRRLVSYINTMDGSFAYARQLYKFNHIQKQIAASPHSSSFLSVVVNDGDHGHIGLLSHEQDLYIYGVYDLVNISVRLVWTTDEWFISDVREQDFTRYIFYRLPTLRNRPLFLYSQALCSKWYGWTKQFQGTDGTLKAFNALEHYLYKEPEIPSLSIDNGSVR